MTDTEQAKVERVARALADRRGSKVVQRTHRLDAIAAIAALQPEPNDRKNGHYGSL